MFLQLSVSHSVHRGSASVHAGIHTPLGRHPQSRHSQSRHTPPGSRDPPGSRPPSAQCMLGDTGHKWAVHILLECILVLQNNYVFPDNIYKVFLTHKQRKNQRVTVSIGIGNFLLDVFILVSVFFHSKMTPTVQFNPSSLLITMLLPFMLI